MDKIVINGGTPLRGTVEISGAKNAALPILIGTILKHTQFADFEAVKKAIDKCVPASKRHLVEANMRAIELGMQY